MDGFSSVYQFFALTNRDVSGFPDFLIIGAPKCGTTSLFQYLGQHPKIYTPPEKEPHFYSYAGEGRPHWGTESVEEYTALFEEAGPAQFCFEASTWYLYSHTAAEKIQEYAPDTKCIVLLRQPVDRAYSAWSFRVQQGWETLGFSEAIEHEEERITDGAWWGTHYLNTGRYYKQLLRFHEQLGPDQVRVFWFGDLRRNSEAVVKDAWSFLGLDPSVALDLGTVHNSTSLPRSRTFNRIATAESVRQVARFLIPKTLRSSVRETLQTFNARKRPSLDSDYRAQLTERVRPNIKHLESLLKVDLSHWLED